MARSMLGVGWGRVAGMESNGCFLAAFHMARLYKQKHTRAWSPLHNFPWRCFTASPI